MLAIIKMINLHFWKSIFGPFFAFIFPIIFIAILGTLLGYDQVFAGSLAIPAMAVGLTAMPQAIFEFKKSVLLKRIGVTKIKPWMFLLAIALFYVLVMFVATFFCVAIGIAIFSGYMNSGREIANNLSMPISIANTNSNIMYNLYAPSLKTVLDTVNWGGFIWGTIMNIIVSVSIGLFLVSVVKTSLGIQALGIPILIISQFLSAQVLPLGMVKSVGAMWGLSYITPFKYSTGLFLESFNGSVGTMEVNGELLIKMDGLPISIANVVTFEKPLDLTACFNSSNIFDINSPVYTYYDGPEAIKVFGKEDKIVNLVMPFVWTGIFGGLSVKFFKWGGR